MAHIVICGAGFAGIETARKLSKNIRALGVQNKYTITLIDKNEYHTFFPLLIAGASSSYIQTTNEDVRHATTIPIENILHDSHITYIQDEIVRIDTAWNTVVTQSKRIEYDYLVLAPGQEANFYSIQGLHAHAYTLKSCTDALKIRSQIDTMIHAHENGEVRIIIAGAGPTGTELAASLAYQMPHILQATKGRCSVSISLIDPSEKILRAFPASIANRAMKRLRSLGVSVYTGARVGYVTDTHVMLEQKEKMPYDILIWAGGTKAPQFFETIPCTKDPRGTIVVNEMMQVTFEGTNASLPRPVFTIGDAALFLYKQKPVPWVAHNALAEADIVVHNITEYIMRAEGQSLSYSFKTYTHHDFPSVLPMGGRYAIITKFPAPGIIGWVLRKGIDLFYFLRIMPIFQALHIWRSARKLYI